ncbi:GP182 protein, partial [Atractosteus spatula]|nr:GP182 protein [Atractosteus spatula]
MDSFPNASDHLHEHNGSLPWFFYECTLELNEDARRMVLFLLYLLLFMVGLAENALVVWVNWRRRHSRSGVTFCVLNVGVADLCVMLVVPFYMLEVILNRVWLWGRTLCKVTHLVFVVNMYGSTFFLAYMTVERYLSLARPAQSWGPPERRRRALICGSLWALALLLTLIENVHVDLLEWDEPGCYMLPSHSFAEWYTAVTLICLVFEFLIPGAIIVTFNVLIARAVKAVPGVEGRRDCWIVHVYSLVFVLCWLPYHLVMFLLMLDDLSPTSFSCNVVELLYFSYCIVECISLFHCVANPILYNFLSKSFRSDLINTVVRYIPREAAQAEPQDANGKPAGARRKDREASDSTTSHSVVIS